MASSKVGFVFPGALHLTGDEGDKGKLCLSVLTLSALHTPEHRDDGEIGWRTN